MFGHIYKIKGDDKWHLYNFKTKLTDCNKSMIDITDDRIFGQKGNEYYPDPNIDSVCSICFSFLPQFNCLVAQH